VVQFLLKVEDSQLADEVQTITAFGFHGGRAMGGKLFESGSRSLLQCLSTRCPEFLHRIQDSAAAFGNFLVAGASNFQIIFFLAAGGMNQVRVRIHKPGQDHPSAYIQFLRPLGVFTGFYLGTRPDSYDPAFAQ